MRKLTIDQLRNWLASQTELSETDIKQLRQDTRAGVRALVESQLRKRAAIQAEAERMERLWDYERSLAAKGFRLIAGIDEAGRGPLAGPVVAAACILPIGIVIPKLNDSKQISPQQREELFHQIREQAVAYGIGMADVDYIDTYNILQATYAAMRRAIRAIGTEPDHLLTDAVTIPDVAVPQQAVIKGDAKSHSIAAASILAKVTRDQMMIEYGRMYPEYGFEQHMGYGTPEHIAALQKYGVCPIHRKSFAPVTALLSTH
ncbi:ribonuclease HII [Effusibacillus dendaii]|uniref:ribonuclease HII n=1 Tax=Effusibacillus dendaii TaxID=2743772 RepID=UPI00190DC1AE|nr:ribonuclease HII [Effusibacillus dendaii]